VTEEAKEETPTAVEEPKLRKLQLQRDPRLKLRSLKRRPPLLSKKLLPQLNPRRKRRRKKLRSRNLPGLL
jgi:hypothetical protein